MTIKLEKVLGMIDVSNRINNFNDVFVMIIPKLESEIIVVVIRRQEIGVVTSGNKRA